jgi:uncharacterized LabA/DUF88 family protein
MARSTEKPIVYAFIDSQNLNLGIQRMGWKMDWRKFRQYLKDKYNVSHAFMFIGYMSENESLYEHMHELGYLIVLKPTVDITPQHVEPSATAGDKAGQTASQGDQPTGKPATPERTIVKGNIDADLVLYAMKEIANYDKAIIVSGDGDFFGLVEHLEQQQKLANIMTPNWQYSTLLKPFEQNIIRLDQLRRQLSYHDRKKK